MTDAKIRRQLILLGVAVVGFLVWGHYGLGPTTHPAHQPVPVVTVFSPPVTYPLVNGVYAYEGQPWLFENGRPVAPMAAVCWPPGQPGC